MKRYFHFILSAWLAGSVFAQSDSTELPKNRFTILPLLSWSQQTGFLAGANAGYTVYQRAQTLQFSTSFIYTMKNQTNVTLSTTRWSDGVKNRINATVSYKNWFDYYYGIGNSTPDSSQEDFTYKTYAFSLSYLRRITKQWSIGPKYDFDLTHVVKFQSDGLFDTTHVPGRKSSHVSGVGVIAIYDSRSSADGVATGGYYQLGVIPYIAAAGSTHQFVNEYADLRYYVSPIESQVIAFQVYGNFTQGNVPFYKMPFFSNYGLMRGYYPGRFRDRQMLAFQGEYRIRLFPQFGIVTWGGYGAVARTLTDFTADAFRHSIGLGIRYIVDPKNNTQIGLDLGVGKNSSYMSLVLGDAF